MESSVTLNLIEEKPESVSAGGIIGFKESGELLIVVSVDVHTGLIVVLKTSSGKIDTISISSEFDLYGNVNMIKKFEPEPYVWLGIDHGKIKLLIDLDEVTIETYDAANDEWHYLGEDSVQVKSDTEFQIIIEEISFWVDISTHTVKIKEKGQLRHKPFYNFLLGFADEFLFDEFNELRKIRN